MAHIELNNITKRFKKITALDSLDLDVKDKEFFVLFGPAGAGKTTILKTIAGIEFPDAGHVKMDGEIVNLIEPAKRNVSMVFENYALYPHISVFDNIASPMRSPLYKKDEQYIKAEVNRVASLLKIDQLMERLPSQLSNGQRQRVALGRCLVRQPKVFLMDEPLAHLDAKLRHFMRAELKEMQASFDTTTIYVTHDYMEALSLGDRIAIINRGIIEQVGTGDQVYYTPSNKFVAKLMGEPEINIFSIKLVNESNVLKVSMLGQSKLFPLMGDVSEAILKSKCDEIEIGFRANDISCSFERTSEEYLAGTVYSLEPIGNKAILIVDVNGQLIRTTVSNDLKADIDSRVFIKFNINNAMFFNKNDEKLIVRHNQSELTKALK